MTSKISNIGKNGDFSRHELGATDISASKFTTEKNTLRSTDYDKISEQLNSTFQPCNFIAHLRDKG